jgi:orotate phosphoribosyltransferase
VIMTELLTTLPIRNGHFLLESGYHTDVWVSLDLLFVNPSSIAPMVASLTERLRGHQFAAVCGPLLGGAFLAQALATILGTAFYYTEPIATSGETALFAAEYRLPPDLGRAVRGLSVAVVDDVISAGSSVRATVAALSEAGASIAVVGSLLTLGDVGETHFAACGVPLESLARRNFVLWKPEDCPLCQAGLPLEDPRAREATSVHHIPHADA